MPKLLPPNLNEAVTFGLDLLDDRSKHELALVGYVDPHTKYSTDFIRVIGEGLGIFDSSNQSLILDLAENHNEGLHFLEWGPEGASREGTVRIVLAAMVERLRGATPSNYMKKLAVILVDPPDDEAPSVTLRSERGEVVAFCYPCGLKVGDLIANRLSVLDADVRAAYLSDWPDDEKEALSSEHLERIGHFSYRGRGRVIDAAEGLVEVQGFVIEMGAMSEGHVDFEINRLDISL